MTKRAVTIIVKAISRMPGADDRHIFTALWMIPALVISRTHKYSFNMATHQGDHMNFRTLHYPSTPA
ncbi:hypothetical protein [Nitrospirillum pindoramense]|uniref:hypothetical protein n=1 Tax=Nitrospirillum amazonense TaxID=28077 RepID=UPI0011A4FD14|nr:hypothetical protein [Nitrospirillum amazonense]